MQAYKAGPEADPTVLFHMMEYYKKCMEQAQMEATAAKQHAQEWKRLQYETYADLLDTRSARDRAQARATRAEQSLLIAQNSIRFLDSILDERLDVSELLAGQGLIDLSSQETVDLTEDEDMEVIDLTGED